MRAAIRRREVEDIFSEKGDFIYFTSNGIKKTRSGEGGCVRGRGERQSREEETIRVVLR